MSTTPKIQFIYTGGTIGMIAGPNGFDCGGNVEAEVAATLNRNGRHSEFGFADFEPVDSSNITPAHWQQIIDHLQARRDEFDGFVVLHGTNTLAHSAAAVSYALEGFGKPVVFTGSQIPFGIPGTDAPGNVRGAFDVASSGLATGVTLFFDGDLMSGVRASKVSTIDRHGFISPHVRAVTPDAVREEPFRTNARGWGSPRPYSRHDVAVITAAPGMSAERFRAMTTPAPDAVIYRAYGAGEGPGDEPGLEGAIRNLTENGTPVVVMSQCVQARIDLAKYAAAGFLNRAGALGAADMTLEALYTKILFLLSQDIDRADLGKWILTDLAGEITPTAPHEPEGQLISAGNAAAQ
ncbi:asparaginase [Arthrobacter sp. ISL-28]|uniref:asparaginase n=1 Tax=Arthrobacter sp. ISL-28 TaxID=2819108 RepID=UPI001BE98AED|nr:asparaginase [Arthrobacter sp. ISL-28]MBT2519440.1 asparaginase [Arthrobacter sp. ISL-28]